MATRRPHRERSTNAASHLEVVSDAPVWSRLTTRAAILLLVLAALVLSLAFPLREYIAQRAEIGALQREISARADRVEALQSQQDRWEEPAYVEEQARARLHYVFPGETGLVLLSPDDVKEARDPEIVVPTDPEVAWYDQLWKSVAAADGS